MSNTKELNSSDEIIVEQTFTGINDDCEIVLKYRSIRCVIQLRRSYLSQENPIGGRLLQELNAADAMSDDMAFDQCLERIHDIAILECKEMVLHLASIYTSHLDTHSLETHLRPPTFLLQLLTTQGKLVIVMHKDLDRAKYQHSPRFLEAEPFSSLHLLTAQASNITIVQHLHLQKVFKVKWRHNIYAFKTTFAGEESELHREISTLQMTRAANSCQPY